MALSSKSLKVWDELEARRFARHVYVPLLSFNSNTNLLLLYLQPQIFLFHCVCVSLKQFAALANQLIRTLKPQMELAIYLWKRAGRSFLLAAYRVYNR